MSARDRIVMLQHGQNLHQVTLIVQIIVQTYLLFSRDWCLQAQHLGGCLSEVSKLAHQVLAIWVGGVVACPVLVVFVASNVSDVLPKVSVARVNLDVFILNLFINVCKVVFHRRYFDVILDTIDRV